MSVSFNVLMDGVLQIAANEDGTKTEPMRPEAFQFPGGEWHLSNLPAEALENPCTWVATVRGADLNELAQAALLANVAHSGNFRARINDKFVLQLPYLPAARADRGEPLGAQVYAKFINAVGADKVFTIDAHSDVMPKMVLNMVELSPVPLIQRAIQEHGTFNGIIAPDKGAVHRAEQLANAVGGSIAEVHYAEKKRDFATGRLESIRFKHTMPSRSGNYLVVDDICDGGGTFKMLADMFAENCSYYGRSPVKNRDRLTLWVTHGIFSGEAHDLRNYYKHIWTTDSHPGAFRLNCATSIYPVWPYMIEQARKVK